jgi:hypothetical protein
MKAGFAERDITPEVGLERPGSYRKVFHQLHHDPCKVRAAVFDDGAAVVALVGVDTLGLPGALVRRAREAITERCGIPGGSVLFGASHSHSAGPLLMVQPGEFDAADDLVRFLAYEISSAADACYVDRVCRQLVDAVCSAFASRAEAVCGAGVGLEDQVAFNRRWRMENGESWSHPRPGNPDIIEAAGPVDPEVGVLGAWDESGRLKGCVVNYACHGTTSPGGISADWIYYLEKTIRGALADDAVVVFLNGACGDVTQVANVTERDRRVGEAGSWFVGGRVGAEAVKVLLSMERGDLSPVSARQSVLCVGRRHPSPERLRRARTLCEEAFGAAVQGHADAASIPLTTELTFAKEILLLDHMLRQAPERDVEIQAVQVGPAVFLANPAEYFCQYGLELKERCAFPFTFPVELANDTIGYVPTREAMGAGGGGYETRLSSYSNLEIGAGDTIRDGLLELAESMTPGSAPAAPAPPPFTAPWEYGNVPPELD